MCRDNQFTMGAGHFGGLASHVQVTEPFAFLLPDDIDPLSAAPLLCAGGTVFSPLRRYIDGPGRVGVIGVGGLGHLAIQFASAMGHEVVAYSSDPTAEEIESFRHLGAAAVVDIGDERAVRGTRGSIDLMLSLVYGDFDLTPYAAALRPRGTLALIGYTTSDLTPLGKHLVYGERSLVGSAGCSRPHMREMLRFASRHSIGALVEPFPMARVNDAVTRMREGRLRYRAVLTRERTEP